VAGLAAVCAVANGAESETLWEGSRFGRCTVNLVQEHGPVEIQRDSGRAQLSAAPGRWQVEASTAADDVVALRVTPQPGADADRAAPVRLRVPARCNVEVRTSMGAIDIEGRHRAALTAESLNGDITLWVAPDDNLNVNAATSGDLTVDFSADLVYLHHVEPSKRGALRIGAGGTGIQLKNKRGAVRVLHEKRH
jgi:hypothetical protein